MSSQPQRETLCLDLDWRFAPGDPTPPLENTHLAGYMANKAGYARGPARPAFDDSDWRAVQLPHDFSVEAERDPRHHVSSGYHPRGCGWYRRHFTLAEHDRGRRVFLRFDAVANRATVYVNGHLLHRHFDGYTPFTIDISDVATFGDEDVNTVAVFVDASTVEGWWYEGAGIYRHAWLEKRSNVHVASDRLFVCPTHVGQDRWTTRIETQVVNAGRSETRVRIEHRLIAPDGRELSAATVDADVAAGATTMTTAEIAIDSPRRWSLRDPALHRVCTRVLVAAEPVDATETSFGYRTIRFDADRGFFLNDERVVLLGTCNHQDHAGVGVAVPDSIHAFRIRRLLALGTNAYRCGHHPPAPELLDACDRLGMLVIDENRTFGSSPERLELLETMVRRDRNHPCVILWSLGNEEAIQGTPIATRIARSMADRVRSLDPSRPITVAMSGGLLNDGTMADVVDVMGINYQWSQHPGFHAKYPALPVFSSESHCTYATRGVTRTDEPAQLFAGDDEHAAPWGATARATWEAFRSCPWLAGLFVWTGFDYRGEPTPFTWPSVSSHWGILDTCGFDKAIASLHRACFASLDGSGRAVLELVVGNDSAAVVASRSAWVFTNCDEVELLVGGASLGRRRLEPPGRVSWTLPADAREASVVGYVDGREVAGASWRAAGPAVALGLEVHADASMPSYPADGEHAIPVTVFALDAAGARVPDASATVSLRVEGGTLLGLGNGDPNTAEPDHAGRRSLFNGLAQAIVRTSATAGTVHVHAESGRLASATLALLTHVVALRPAVPPTRRRVFLSDWQMGPLGDDPPAVEETADATDMNTWERVQPGPTGTASWTGSAGRYRLLRTRLRPTRSMARGGGRLRFSAVAGQVEVFLGDRRLLQFDAASAASHEVSLPPMTDAAMLTLRIRGTSLRSGLCGRVEVVAATD
jgi:beta-galactosidase